MYANYMSEVTTSPCSFRTTLLRAIKPPVGDSRTNAEANIGPRSSVEQMRIASAATARTVRQRSAMDELAQRKNNHALEELNETRTGGCEPDDSHESARDRLMKFSTRRWCVGLHRVLLPLSLSSTSPPPVLTAAAQTGPGHPAIRLHDLSLTNTVFEMAPVADFLAAAIPKSLHVPTWLLEYQRGTTPLSTNPVVIGTLVGYLTVIFGLREIMRDRQALKLQFLFQLHNALLSLGSLILLVLMLEEIVPIWYKGGLFNAICHPRSWTPVSATRTKRDRT